MVARADDVGRPHDRRLVAVDFLHDAIAFSLEGTVGLARDCFDCRVERFVQRAAVIDDLRLLEIVDRDGRGKDVTTATSFQEFGGVAHVSRHVAGIIDHDVPGTFALQGVEAVVDLCITVADEFFDLAAVHSGAATTIEHRDRVTALERKVDLVRTDKASAAEKQDVELFVRRRYDGARPRSRSTEDGRACADELSACGHGVSPYFFFEID